MEFKVGDRVEVLAPAEGVGNWDKNNIGYGTVERVSTDASGSVQIKVDANDCAWWYKLGKVRLVRPVNEPTPTPSITQAEADRMRGDKIREELYGVKYATPTIEADKLKAGTMQRPITVGTQVRLTGVVTERNPVGEIRIDLGKHFVVWIPETHEALEVIRQPFKRGEVVYLKSNPTNEIPCRILEDEDATTKGQVLLVGEYYPTRTEYVDPTLYERRP